jgi:hypothetical protein
MSRYALTAERLRELMEYDPETGVMTWRASGKPAGDIHPRGYVQIWINSRKYLRHHLAFLYAHGRWATASVDHVNGDPSDDRLCNLREATHAQNMWNKGRSKSNTSGFKWVTRSGRKWKALLQTNGRKYYVGLFDTPEEAHAEAVKVASRLHGEFLRVA